MPEIMDTTLERLVNKIDTLTEQVALLKEEIAKLKQTPPVGKKIGRVKNNIALQHLQSYGICSDHNLKDLRDRGIFQVNKHVFVINPRAVRLTYLYDVEKCIEVLKKYQSGK